MGWMHPFYGELREAIAQHKYSNDQQREILELNLKRARIFPASKERYVLVNAAQQRLFMYEDGKPVELDGRGRRQDEMADADARGLHPVSRRSIHIGTCRRILLARTLASSWSSMA